MSRKRIGSLLLLATTSVLVLAVVMLNFFGKSSSPELATKSPVAPSYPSENRPAVLGDQTTADAKTTNISSSDDTIVERSKLYNLINAHRRANRLGILITDPQLERSAQLKLEDMVAREYWEHNDPKNRPPWSFFSQAGFHYAKAGENLSFALNSAWDVFAAWQDSPAHDEQMLTSEYTHMGLAVECFPLTVVSRQTQAENSQSHACVTVLHLGAK